MEFIKTVLEAHSYEVHSAVTRKDELEKVEKLLITLKDDLEEAPQKLEKSDAAKSQFVFIVHAHP